MTLLIDTHSLIWYVDQHHLLSRPAHAAITDPANDLLVSAATIWEIAIKVGNGKLKLDAPCGDKPVRARYAHSSSRKATARATLVRIRLRPRRWLVGAFLQSGS